MTVVMAKYPQVEIGGVPGEGNFLRCFSELNIALRMVFIGVYAYTEEHSSWNQNYVNQICITLM